MTLLLIHVFIIMLKIIFLVFCCLNCARIVCRQESWRERDQGKVCKCNTMLASCLRGYRRRLIHLLLFLAIFYLLPVFTICVYFLQLVIYKYIYFYIYIYFFLDIYIFLIIFYFFNIYIYIYAHRKIRVYNCTFLGTTACPWSSTLKRTYLYLFYT